MFLHMLAMFFVLYCFNVQLYVPHIILITIFLFRKNIEGYCKLDSQKDTHSQYLKLQL